MRLSHRLVEVQEEERRQIARELHDEIGQVLTGLKLRMEVCARQSPSAVDALVAATMRIGKCISDLTAPTLSSDWTVLLKRPATLPF